MDIGLDSPLWHRVAALQPRLRAHVRVQRRATRGDVWYLLTDPNTGRFHRVTPSAWALIGRLDGRFSLDTLWRHVHAQLGAEAPTQTEALHLLAQLRDADLVAVDAMPDLGAVQARRAARERGKRAAAVNPLAFKVPLFNPSRLLDALHPLARGLFSGWGLAAWLVLMGLAGMQLAGHAETLSQALRTQALSSDVLWSMWFAYPLVKLLHELAHALAVRAWGGTVREVGLNLMVLTPVPYVDATAATQFPQRHRRMVVGAAGILAELAIGALAALAWMAADAPSVRQAALAVMMLCTLSTLLFNANPLVRFDGYYVLSDALDIPNLAARAQAVLHRLLGRAVGAPSEPTEDSPRRRAALGAYALAALAYRWAVALGIAVLLHEKHPLLALAAVAYLLVTQLALPAWRALRALALDARLHGRRLRAVGTAALACAAAAVLVAQAPAPLVTVQQGVVGLPEQAILRAPVAGTLEAVHVANGSHVEAGQLIATLANPDLLDELLGARARRTQLDVEVYQALLVDAVRAQRLAGERDALDAQIARLQERLDSLAVRAQVPGTLALPRDVDAEDHRYEQGAEIGYVIDEQPLLVKVALTEAQAALMRAHGTSEVDVRLAQAPGTVLHGVVERETPGVTHQLPSPILGSAHGGPIPTDPADAHGQRALQPVSVIDVRVPTQATDHLGMRAWVRLDHGSEALLTQGWRTLRQLFLRSLGATT